MRSFVFLTALFIATLFSTVSPVFADSSSGISVTPSILRVDLAQDEPHFEIVYKNNSPSDITLDLSATDFSELEEGWRVKFLGVDEAKHYNYSLASWLDFERKSLSLKSGEEGRLNVTIDKDSLSPGGHYASILARISALGESSKQVEVNGILSTLLFVRAHTGREIESASISDISVNQSPPFLSFPTSLVVRINNVGNTELVPVGVLTIRDPFGRSVAKGTVNPGANYSLPETLRKFEVVPKMLQSILLPGRYSAEVYLSYGKNQTAEIKKEVGFYYFDWRELVLLVLLIIGLIILFRLIRRKH